MTSDTATNYCETFLPRATLQKLEAGAFGQLCEHLRQRSDQVQNIDLMTISGFCRNCLAKWLVVEARKLSDDLKVKGATNNLTPDDKKTIQALDALGYDEAAEYVYGMAYTDWKNRYSKKATDAVMEKYNGSKDLWATHDKDLLAVRAEKMDHPMGGSIGDGLGLLSNVCCQDPEEVATKEAPSKSRVATPQVPPPPPGSTKFTFSILTISDRASAGQYETGDLSGPAVKDAVLACVQAMNGGDSTVECTLKETAVVKDNIEAIENRLKEWSSDAHQVDMVLTTGGTGFAARDVTPEATRAILNRECHGLMSYISSECSKLQPLAALSRGTAGVCGSTFIANLPGNPKGVEEVIPLLLPLALHAIKDLQQQ